MDAPESASIAFFAFSPSFVSSSLCRHHVAFLFCASSHVDRQPARLSINPEPHCCYHTCVFYPSFCVCV